MQIIISGKGVALTDAIEDYVNRKMAGLEKFLPAIIRATVVVGVETKHHLKGDIFYAECKIEIPGNDLFAKKMAGTAYAAIDLLKNKVEGELKKNKIKTRSVKKRAQAMARRNKEYLG